MPAQEVSFEHEIAETILAAHAGLEKAAAAYDEAARVKQACKSEIPALVDLAVKTASIEASEREDFARALENPVTTLKLFKFALEQRSAASTGLNTREVDSYGRPATKTASANKRSAVVGANTGAAANSAFDDALGFGG